MWSSIRRIIPGVAWLVASAATVDAQTYDAVADFAGTNGSGPWSYWRQSASTTTLLTTPFTACGNPQVTGFGTPWFVIPVAYFNRSTSQVVCNTAVLPAQAGFLHPGGDFTSAILRFTAPATATYVFDSRFWAADYTGFTNTVLSFALNDITTFTGSISGFSPNGIVGPVTTSLTTLNLVAGDRFDVRVGPLANGFYQYGTTGFRLSVTRTDPVVSVPEPGSFVLVGIGLIGLAGAARRRGEGAPRGVRVA